MSIEKRSEILNWKKRYESEKNTQLQYTDIYDRIINLRLTAGSAESPDYFVIRSDYEIYSPSFYKDLANNSAVAKARTDGRIRKCVRKPSIKVSYKQVSGNTMIDLDIYIANFYILTSDGKVLKQFSASKYPLRAVEVQMGYFGQFAEMYKNQEGGVPTAEQYFNFESRNGIQTITCNVEYVQTDKLPPDYTLHIHGWVGSSVSESVEDVIKTLEREENEEDPDYTDEEDTSNHTSMVSRTDTYGDSDDYEVILDTSDGKSFKCLPQFLFNNITRRFFRKAIYALNEEQRKAILEGVKKDKNYLMVSYDAMHYGVNVYLSTGVYKTYKMAKGGRALLYSEYGEEVEDSEVFALPLSGKTPMQALNQFMSRVSPDLRVTQTINGDYLMYLDSEAKNPKGLSRENSLWYVWQRPKDVPAGEGSFDYDNYDVVSYTWKELSAYVHKDLVSGADTEENAIDEISTAEVEADNYVLKYLPAVYNINIDYNATIECPYFWFLSPFDSLEFSSRYALGGIKPYYADKIKESQDFVVLWYTVDFATVEEVNSCEIVAQAEVA